jgi:hypothetical protein
MVKLPALKTLATYGLSMLEWLGYLGLSSEEEARTAQVTCPICERVMEQFVVDHQHVRGWKTMPPEQRKQYVRGVICRGCNYFVLTRQVGALEHENAGKYLREYEERRPK